MYTLVSIVIGAKLDKSKSDKLFSSADRALEGTNTANQAYLFLLSQVGTKDFNELVSKNHGIVIAASNEILEKLGLEDKYLLGMHTNSH